MMNEKLFNNYWNLELHITNPNFVQIDWCSIIMLHIFHKTDIMPNNMFLYSIVRTVGDAHPTSVCIFIKILWLSSHQNPVSTKTILDHSPLFNLLSSKVTFWYVPHKTLTCLLINQISPDIQYSISRHSFRASLHMVLRAYIIPRANYLCLFVFETLLLLIQHQRWAVHENSYLQTLEMLCAAQRSENVDRRRACSNQSAT